MCMDFWGFSPWAAIWYYTKVALILPSLSYRRLISCQSWGEGRVRFPGNSLSSALPRHLSSACPLAQAQAGPLRWMFTLRRFQTAVSVVGKASGDSKWVLGTVVSQTTSSLKVFSISNWYTNGYLYSWSGCSTRGVPYLYSIIQNL